MMIKLVVFVRKKIGYGFYVDFLWYDSICVIDFFVRK